MTKYIVSKYKDRGDAGRLAVGRIAGGVGIAVNVVLFAAKLALGLITGSVSVVADAVNNLSDADRPLSFLSDTSSPESPPTVSIRSDMREWSTFADSLSP